MGLLKRAYHNEILVLRVGLSDYRVYIQESSLYSSILYKFFITLSPRVNVINIGSKVETKGLNIHFCHSNTFLIKCVTYNTS